MTLDRYDRQILTILQQDGRISNQELADKIGLSASPCLRRVRTLEEDGIITGYRALCDAKKLDLTLMALIHIAIDRHTPNASPTSRKKSAPCPKLWNACSSPAKPQTTNSRLSSKTWMPTRPCSSTKSPASKASAACNPVLSCARWWIKRHYQLVNKQKSLLYRSRWRYSQNT